MSASFLSAATLWLASISPAVVDFAPYSYVVCFLISLILILGLFLLIKIMFFSGTTRKTYIDFEYKNRAFHVKKSENIEDFFLDMKDSNSTAPFRNARCFAVFKSKLAHPDFYITNEVGLKVRVLEAVPRNSCIQFHLIEESVNDNPHGTFRIELNGHSHS